VLFESNNGIRVHGYFDKIVEPTNFNPVPANRILSFLPDAATCASVSWGIDPSHATSAKGFISAAPEPSSSQICEASVILEYWPDAVFMMNTYNNLFHKLYIESNPLGETNYCIAGARCTAKVDAASIFTTNAKGFDIGYACNLDVYIAGLFGMPGGVLGLVNDDANTANNARLNLRNYPQSASAIKNNRVVHEYDAQPIAFVSFNGADLSIKRNYNVTAISRVGGEAIGDYWIDFVRPSNTTAIRGEVVLVAHATDFALCTTLMGGGDGVTNNRVRVRCINSTNQTPLNPARVMVAIF
jgi:hypothetical protein